MKLKTDNRIRLAFVLALGLLTLGGFFSATGSSSSSGTAPDLEYFKGEWTVAIKANPTQSFKWTVKEDLQGGWMVGIVELNGEKVTTDFWRQRGKKIERFAFTSDGLFVKIESAGWVSDQLVLTGVMSDKTGETKVRETITRVNERRFHALWEKQSADGKWITFADEICTK